MAQVAGQVIVGMLVSTAVQKIGPKLGLSESTSEMLGMAAGMYAGGSVGGGSTTATAETARATSGQVGTQLPAGYGGPTNPTGSGFAGTGPTTNAGAGGAYEGASAARSMSPAVSPQASRGALSRAIQAPPAAPTFQAETTAPIEGGGTVGKVGSSVSRGQAPPSGEGMLTQSQGVQRGAPDASQIKPQGDTARKVIDEGTVGRTGGGTGEGGETNWWKRLFTPEKTMDLAIAGMQGYAEAGMAKEEREYAEGVKQKNAADWGAAYGTQVGALNQTYPSGYRGP